jgi:hypothetical protein
LMKIGNDSSSSTFIVGPPSACSRPAAIVFDERRKERP